MTNEKIDLAPRHKCAPYAELLQKRVTRRIARVQIYSASRVTEVCLKRWAHNSQHENTFSPRRKRASNISNIGYWIEFSPHENTAGRKATFDDCKRHTQSNRTSTTKQLLVSE